MVVLPMPAPSKTTLSYRPMVSSRVILHSGKITLAPLLGILSSRENSASCVQFWSL